jgi:[ribosomal protein S5]-alanine N-acetyltransferase
VTHRMVRVEDAAMQDWLILTERCKIRNFKESDLDFFISYRNNLNWMRYQGFKGLSKEEYRNALLLPSSPENGIQLAVADRTTDLPMGDVYIRQEPDAWWVGYTIHPDYERKGLMLEAFSGLIRYLKESKTCAKALAGCLPENGRSRNLLLKAGFTYLYFDKESGEEVYVLNF